MALEAIRNLLILVFTVDKEYLDFFNADLNQRVFWLVCRHLFVHDRFLHYLNHPKIFDITNQEFF